MCMLLLSLWNGDTDKVDAQELLYVDKQMFDAMLWLIRDLYENNRQLDSIVTEDDMAPIIEKWGDVFK